jgi:uncharacterized protein YqjF (DUF2071 family)
MRWLLAQRWDDLLLAHWRADPDAVRRLLPAGVEPDTYDGTAWVAIVAFVMTGTRPALAPRSLSLPPIPELNVRTYVRVGDVSGVWFLSLDASSPFFVAAGRALYGLRYRLARMAVAADGNRLHYLSTGAGGAFSATYEPIGPPALAQAGSLEHSLVERYRLFSERRGRLVTAQVAHEPWRLQPAQARIEVNCMAPPGLAFDGPPLLHFSRTLEALISTPEEAERQAADRMAAPVLLRAGQDRVAGSPAP